MTSKQHKCVIEVLKAGEWHRTWWTSSRDDTAIKPVYRWSAERCLKRAQKKFPYATYRIVEVEESLEKAMLA